MLDEGAIGVGVLRRDFRDAGAGFVEVAVKADAGSRAEDGIVSPWVHLQILEAELVQFQLAQHRREMDHDVRRGADIEPVAGDEVVLGADRAADDVPPFEHEYLAARLGQIAGTGEAVVSRSDNHDIVMRHSFY